jgi:hypothetical protein
MVDDAPGHVAEYIKAGTEAFILLKTLYPLLPTQSRDEVETKIQAAQDALEKANVELAKAWNYKLCKCSFPPQIMLWDKTEGANICPKCSDRNPRPPERPSYEEDFINVRG